MTYTYHFEIPLSAPDCPAGPQMPEGAIRANGLSRDLFDAALRLGDSFPADSGDFDEGFRRIRLPGDGGVVTALCRWHCGIAGKRYWARLDFTLDRAADQATLVAATTIALTPAVVAAAHYIDYDAEDLLEVLPPGDERDALLLAFGQPTI